MQSLSNAKYHRRRTIRIVPTLFVINQRSVQPTIVNFDLLSVEDDRFLRRQEIFFKRNALRDEVFMVTGPFGKVVGRFWLLEVGSALSYTLALFGERRGVFLADN